MMSLVMGIVMCLSCGVAAYCKWQMADLQVELDAAKDEAAEKQRLFEMEMVKSCNLRRANAELTEQVQRLNAQRQVVAMRMMPRTIYFN